ncbi:MAG: LapA family protein, partial [Thermosynechococcaceae cyanobacterium]
IEHNLGGLQMRQVNFTLIFVICLALVLFGIENTQPVAIKIIEGVELKAPLSVELIVTLGLGAVLAWVFSVWVQVQSILSMKEVVQERDSQINDLQGDIERYKAELEEQQRLLPSVSSSREERVSTAEIEA